jgi:uncharacterized membrane protein YesL
MERGKAISTMLNPFAVLWRAVRDLFDELLLAISINVIWALVTLPFVFAAIAAALAGEWVLAAAAMLTAVLPGAPATVGLLAVALRISEGRVSRLREYPAAMRRWAKPAWQIGLIWVGGLLLLMLNAGYYAQITGIFGGILLGLVLYLSVFWILLGFYAMPLIVLQEQPRLRQIGRNALVLVFSQPLFALITAVLLLILVGISFFTVAPLSLITAMLIAQWSLRAAQAVIADSRARQAAREAAAAPVEERGRRGQVRPRGK